MKLHKLLELVPDETPLPDREMTRRNIGALQALRLALFQHMFLRAVSVPPFSRANDISRDDVLEMFFTLRVEDGLAQLRRAFPIHFPSIGDFDVAEPSDYPDSSATGYGQIHRDFIDPDRALLCPDPADHHRHRQRVRRARVNNQRMVIAMVRHIGPWRSLGLFDVISTSAILLRGRIRPMKAPSR